MAEIRCEECGSIIPNGAKACPNCGCPINEKNTTNSFWQKLRNYFYTEDDDPYVDLAAKLIAVVKVIIVVAYILLVPFQMLFLVIFGKSAFAFGIGLLQFFIITLAYGGIYAFWWWVGNIIVNGIRKIRQSKIKQ